MSSKIAFTHEAGSVTVLVESPHYMTPMSIGSLDPQDVTKAIADLLDAKRAQQAYLAAHTNNEPAPDTRREGSASTWPAPAAHSYELCVLEHTCDTCKYDSVEPEPEYCLGCTNNKCRWEPAPWNDEIRGAK